MYVADTGNDRVVELSPAGAAIGEWGSKGTADGRFRSPTGIAVDAAGDVYVVDSEDNRVEVFEADGRFLAKWGLRGTGPGELSQPSAIAVDCERRRVRRGHKQQPRRALRPRSPRTRTAAWRPAAGRHR